MDIRNLMPQVRELEVKLPTGEDTGIVLKLVGQDSKQFKPVSMKWATILQKEKSQDIEQLSKARCERAAASIVGWSGLEEDGVQIQYSPEKASELMHMPELGFIVDQIEQFVAVRVNFFRASEAKSS